VTATDSNGGAGTQCPIDSNTYAGGGSGSGTAGAGGGGAAATPGTVNTGGGGGTGGYAGGSGIVIVQEAGTWHTIVSVNFSSGGGGVDNTGFNGYGIRQWVGVPAYSSPASATQIRVTVIAASNSNLVLSDVFVGHSAGPVGTTTQNYDGSQVRATFSGVNSVTVPINSTTTSDAINYAFNPAKDLVVGINATSGGTRQNLGMSNSFEAYWNSSQASCPAPATTCSPSFTGGLGQADFVAKVEIFY
jgi:hypothetical protein